MWQILLKETWNSKSYNITLPTDFVKNFSPTYLFQPTFTLNLIDYSAWVVNPGKQVIEVHLLVEIYNSYCFGGLQHSIS